MNDVHSLLLQVISAALFGKKAPDVSADLLVSLVDESKAQAVYLLAFSVLDSQLQENSRLKSMPIATKNSSFTQSPGHRIFLSTANSMN